MFLNYSNHPSALWSAEQRTEAQVYGPIVDMPFPTVPADMDEAGILTLADSETRRILDTAPAAVLCQGEMTLAFAIVRRLQAAGIPVFAACSARESREELNPDGSTLKSACFRFVCFRRYEI